MPLTLPLNHDADDSTTRRALYSLSSAVAKSKRVVVVTGAGISCSSGIPDFRSTDGLYNLVKAKYPDVVLKGRDLFDSSLFRDPTSTSVFYTFISQLKSRIDTAQPSATHRFIKNLDSKSKLLRSYTQNIDGLEQRAGLSSAQKGKGKMKDIRNVLLHGDIHQVRCQICSAVEQCSEFHLSLFADGKAPECPQCTKRSEARVASSRRALRIGSLRPAIVLYDEPHPHGDLIGTMQTSDLMKRPDLLIIMGTSLKVYGLKKLVKEFAKVVHTSGAKNGLGGGKVIYVNKSELAGSEWEGVIDYHVVGATDDWVEKVQCEWRKIRPSDWELQTTLEDSSLPLKVVKQHETKSSKGAKKISKENVPPPPMESLVSTKLNSPKSPSKRRADGTHYDIPSSPSKRRSLVNTTISNTPCTDSETTLVHDPFLIEHIKI